MWRVLPMLGSTSPIDKAWESSGRGRGRLHAHCHEQGCGSELPSCNCVGDGSTHCLRAQGLKKTRSKSHRYCPRHGWGLGAPNVDHLHCEHRTPYLAWLQSVGANASSPPDTAPLALPAPPAPPSTPEAGHIALLTSPAPLGNAGVVVETPDCGSPGEAQSRPLVGEVEHNTAGGGAASGCPASSSSVGPRAESPPFDTSPIAQK